MRKPRSSILDWQAKAARFAVVVSVLIAMNDSRHSRVQNWSWPRLVKTDNSRQPFDESKLRNSMVRALEKRPVPSDAFEKAVGRLVHKLRTMGEREVPSRMIGELVMEELRGLDEVAYVRFASVYRSFQDVTEFQDEIKRLQDISNATASREQMSLLPELLGKKK